MRLGPHRGLSRLPRPPGRRHRCLQICHRPGAQVLRKKAQPHLQGPGRLRTDPPRNPLRRHPGYRGSSPDPPSATPTGGASFSGHAPEPGSSSTCTSPAAASRGGETRFSPCLSLPSSSSTARRRLRRILTPKAASIPSSTSFAVPTRPPEPPVRRLRGETLKRAVGAQWELRGALAHRDENHALGLSRRSGCCRCWFEKQPAGKSRRSVKGVEMGQCVRAERKSKGETLVSERQDEPQSPLPPYRPP